MSDGIPIMRVPISLPCQVPVSPGTPDTDAPIEERSERCAVDAWWMVGKAMICDYHLRRVMPDEHADILAEMAEKGFELNPREVLPWGEMHRYPQEQAGLS